jgi:hypothetical protein
MPPEEGTMKKTIVGAVALFSIVSLAAAKHSDQKHGDDRPVPRILAFDTMYGVDGPFVGDARPIRGVIGDELPWVIGSARGRLDTDGHIKIRVHGLVFANDPLVPPELIGKNDEDQFRAAVSCLSEDADEHAIRAMATSDGFPATPQGDSEIDGFVQLPNPCIAPIIFILAGSEEKWFAVTGFESETH